MTTAGGLVVLVVTGAVAMNEEIVLVCTTFSVKSPVVINLSLVTVLTVTVSVFQAGFGSTTVTVFAGFVTVFQRVTVYRAVVRTVFVVL